MNAYAVWNGVPGCGISLTMIESTFIPGCNTIPAYVNPIAADTAEDDPFVVIFLDRTAFLIFLYNLLSFLNIIFHAVLNPGKVLF